MLGSKQTTYRLAALAALGSMLALIATVNASAYPVTPEDEPLHLATVPIEAFPEPTGSRTAPTARANVVPIRDDPTGGTDWAAVLAIAAAAGMAALALLMASHALTSHRRSAVRRQAR